MKGHALRFVDCDTAELWEILPEFADSTAPYRKFVDAVCQLYPGSDAEQRWLIADMEKLVADTSKTGILSLADLGKYHRDFVSITTFLITKNRLAAPKQSCAFARAFPSELWSQVSYQLQLKFPDHFPDDPYALEQIHNATRFVLHGTAASALTHDRPLPLAPTLAPAPKTESTELSILIDTMKQFVATLDNQSKPSALTSSLLVSMPPTPPVPTFQLSPQERIQEIEKDLSALRSQVHSREQAALKPPATLNLFVSAAISVPVPMPAPKRRCTPVLAPEFDDTPQVVFVSCPATLTSKVAHGPVFHSDCRTTETTDVAVFILTPSAPVSLSELVPKCTATAEHPAATSHSISVPTFPSCAFASAETLLATAHTDGIHPEPVYTSDHPTRSVSIPPIPNRTFAAPANSLTTANTDGIVSEIVCTSVHATTAASFPVAVPATVDHKCAPASPPLVAIVHLELASAPAPALL